MARSLALERFALRRKPDEDVFARAMSGDPVAFSEVYRRYEKRIYGFCLSRTLDAESAADATQEVFIRLLNAAPDSVRHPRGWLFAVARNVVVDVVRRRAAKPESTETEEASLALERLTSPDPAERVLLREDARGVFLALRTLRPRYRTALILREMHGQSSADIADAFGTTPGAVDTLLCRARDAFGSAYAELSGLPAECREAVALAYKRTGTGLDEAETERLEEHLAGCPRCRAEDRKARSPKHLRALLPFMLPARSLSENTLAQAAAVLASQPLAPITEIASSSAGGVVARAIAAVLAATLVAGPTIASVPRAPRAAAPAAPSAPSGSPAAAPVSSESSGSDARRGAESGDAAKPRAAGTEDRELRENSAEEDAEDSGRAHAASADREDEREEVSADREDEAPERVAGEPEGKDAPDEPAPSDESD